MKPVWIIDDDRSIRWVFEKALTRENIAFKTFSSADEALLVLATETPQVVVSDIRMPGESGLDLTRSVVQVLDTGGRPAGTGFVVGQRLPGGRAMYRTIDRTMTFDGPSLYRPV